MTLVAGLDVGGTKCAVVMGRVQPEGVRLVDKLAFATPAGPEAALSAMMDGVATLAERYGAPRAIGVSCGGPLDGALGLVLGPPNLPGWESVDVLTPLRDRFGVPAALRNDADACALAEWRWGAGQGSRHMIFLTFGTGMGAGLILDGRLYTGATNLAGEVGHMRLADDGPPGYGKAGSFEGFCSGGGIARLAAQRGWTGEATTRAIAEAAVAGDPLAREVFREVARRLGQGLAILVDVLNPDRIVIGSIFARQRALLEPLMWEALREEALEGSVAAVRVVPAALGEHVGDYAALSVAVEALG